MKVQGHRSPCGPRPGHRMGWQAGERGLGGSAGAGPKRVPESLPSSTQDLREAGAHIPER